VAILDETKHRVNVSRHRDLFQELARREGLDEKNWEAWYGLRTSQIKGELTSIIRKHYSNSLGIALSKVFPEHEWLPWKFRKVPGKFWDSKNNRLAYFKWLAIALNVKNMEDWYQLSKLQLSTHYGRGLLDKFDDSPSQALIETFLDHKWKPWKFVHPPRNSSKQLINSQQSTSTNRPVYREDSKDLIFQL